MSILETQSNPYATLPLELKVEIMGYSTLKDLPKVIFVLYNEDKGPESLEKMKGIKNRIFSQIYALLPSNNKISLLRNLFSQTPGEADSLYNPHMKEMMNRIFRQIHVVAPKLSTQNEQPVSREVLSKEVAAFLAIPSIQEIPINSIADLLELRINSRVFAPDIFIEAASKGLNGLVNRFITERKDQEIAPEGQLATVDVTGVITKERLTEVYNEQNMIPGTAFSEEAPLILATLRDGFKIIPEHVEIDKDELTTVQVQSNDSMVLGYALMSAAENGHVDVVKAILGVEDVNILFIWIYRAMKKAIENGHAQVIKTIIETPESGYQFMPHNELVQLFSLIGPNASEVLKAMIETPGSLYNQLPIEELNKQFHYLVTRGGHPEIRETLIKTEGSRYRELGDWVIGLNYWNMVKPHTHFRF